MYTEKDRRLARLAAEQHHVFLLQQARGLGFTRHEAMGRVASGAWLRLAAGVYALPGTLLTHRARLRAATLALPGSVASHESAGELREYPLVPHGLVVVSREDVRPNRTALGRIRRICDFRPSDHEVIDGIPVTSAVRTAGDLAAVMGAGRYRSMIDKLLVRGDFSSAQRTSPPSPCGGAVGVARGRACCGTRSTASATATSHRKANSRTPD